MGKIQTPCLIGGNGTPTLLLRKEHRYAHVLSTILYGFSSIFSTLVNSEKKRIRIQAKIPLCNPSAPVLSVIFYGFSSFFSTQVNSEKSGFVSRRNIRYIKINQVLKMSIKWAGLPFLYFFSAHFSTAIVRWPHISWIRKKFKLSDNPFKSYWNTKHNQ